MKSNFPTSGKVTSICIRPARIVTVVFCDSATADVDGGLEGDHFGGKPGAERMVTFIQAEHIELVAKLLNKPVDPGQLRRNIVVEGINLLALKGKKFQIGDAIFEGTTPCPPCARMEENLGHGGFNAMRGHGGINARVLQSGKFAVGDSLNVLADPVIVSD